MKNDNILTALDKIKTAIASDNGGNTQTPANLTDALSGIAGAITEQKGSGSGGAVVGDGNKVIEIKQNPDNSDDWIFSSPITWSEIEQAFFNGTRIILRMIYSYMNATESIEITNCKYTVIQVSNIRHLMSIVGTNLIGNENSPESLQNNVIHIYIDMNNQTPDGGFDFQKVDFNNIKIDVLRYYYSNLS